MRIPFDQRCRKDQSSAFLIAPDLNTCMIDPQTLRHPAVLKYVADGESETSVMLATERAEALVSHLERMRDDEEMTKKQM